MSIYDKNGNELKIIGFVGVMQPINIHAKVSLVKVEYPNKKHSFKFAEFLTADDRYVEISDEILKAPHIILDQLETMNAVKQAF